MNGIADRPGYISHKGAGSDVEIEDLADMMLQLQEQGARTSK